MPKYNHKCLKCKNVFDIKEKDNDKFVCPKCESKKIKNLIKTSFSGSADDCCSGEDACGINCKIDKKKESSCGCGGCC